MLSQYSMCNSIPGSETPVYVSPGDSTQLAEAIQHTGGEPVAGRG